MTFPFSNNGNGNGNNSDAHDASEYQVISSEELDRMARQMQNELIASDPAAADYFQTKQIRTINVGELFSMEFKPREYILEPIIQTQGTTMLYSKRGVGKTYLALGIACAVAAGTRFLRWVAPKPNKVLYVDGEMPGVTMRERLAGIIGAMNMPPDAANLNIITPDLQVQAIPNLSGSIGQQMVEDEIRDSKLLVLDNLSTLCRAGKENESDSWIPVQEWVLSLRRKGISVLMVHHAGKNGAQRGTSSREDVLDTVIALRHPSDYGPEQGARFEIHYEKARNTAGIQLEPFEVQISSKPGIIDWQIHDIREVHVSRARELFQIGCSVRDVSQELGISIGATHKLKHKLGL